MNSRAIPGAYLFRLYVCDKEMSWPHHIGETHQPEWVIYVRDSEKFRLTNVIPERIIFVRRGITVYDNPVPIWEQCMYEKEIQTFQLGAECCTGLSDKHVFMLLFYFSWRYRQKPRKPLRYDTRARGQGAGTLNRVFSLHFIPLLTNLLLFTKCFLGDQSRKIELGGACGKEGGQKRSIQVSSGGNLRK